MSDWIRTKAGLQMAETIVRYLPRITVCLEELAKDKPTPVRKNPYWTPVDLEKDVLKLCDEMDIRKQENINLNFKINELKHKVEKGG